MTSLPHRCGAVRNLISNTKHTMRRESCFYPRKSDTTRNPLGISPSIVKQLHSINQDGGDIMNKNTYMYMKIVFFNQLQGWGLLKLRSLIAPLAKFSILLKYLSDYLHQIHIWQVSPQLSCGDTCQIWTWYSIGNQCCDNGEKSGN